MTPTEELIDGLEELLAKFHWLYVDDDELRQLRWKSIPEVIISFGLINLFL